MVVSTVTLGVEVGTTTSSGAFPSSVLDLVTHAPMVVPAAEVVDSQVYYWWVEEVLNLEVIWQV
jgi:hypothetical protein